MPPSLFLAHLDENMAAIDVSYHPQPEDEDNLLYQTLRGLFEGIVREREQYRAHERELRARITEFETANANYREEIMDLESKTFKLQHLLDNERKNSKQHIDEISHAMVQLQQNIQAAEATTNQTTVCLEQLQREHASCASQVSEIARENRVLQQRSLDHTDHNAQLARDFQKVSAMFEASEKAAKSMESDLNYFRTAYRQTVKDCACLVHALLHSTSQEYSMDSLRNVLMASELQPAVVEGLLHREGAFKRYITTCKWDDEEYDRQADDTKRRSGRYSREDVKTPPRRRRRAAINTSQTKSGTIESIDREGDTIFINRLSC